MNKIYCKIIFVLGILLFVGLNPHLTQAATDEGDKQIVMPQYFNSKDQEIKPYSEEEYIEKTQKALNESTVQQSENNFSIQSVSNPNYYDTFGYAGFRNYVWINGGKTYRNPIYVNFEILNRTTGKAIYFYNSSGTYQGKVVFPKYGNIWYVANVDYLVRGRYYKFRLVSESGEFSEIMHGNVAYDG